MRRHVIALVLSTVLLAGCAAHPKPRPSVVSEDIPTVADWRASVTTADQARLAALPQSWTKALATVPARLKPKVKAEGQLVDPAGALDLPALSPGVYRCRLVRLGGRVGFASLLPDFCHVGGGANGVSFTKQGGGSLSGGWLYADTENRLVFLGTRGQQGGPGKGAAAYGADPSRDVVGVVERVAPFRWRLVVPGAAAGLDVYELVPFVAEAAPAVRMKPARS